MRATAIFLVLATALAQGGFESANNANADDWYTQRVEAEQNGCTNTRAAHVWTEFHLGIPASSDAEFESNIPALKEAAASAINLHCSDVASHCPATLVADDLCVLPEMVTRRRLNSVSVTGIRAIFVVGVNTIKQATSIKKYVLSEQFKDDMLASMITANVQTSQDITVLTVYKESIQRNVNDDHNCHNSCDHKCTAGAGTIVEKVAELKADATDALGHHMRAAHTYTACHQGVIRSMHNGVNHDMTDIQNFRCFVNEGDACHCNCHQDE